MIKKCTGVATKDRDIKKYTGGRLKHVTVVVVVIFDIMYYFRD